MARGRPYKCPYCETSGENVSKGFRYNKSGKVRLRRCKKCGRRWTTGTVSEEDACTQAPATGQFPPEPATDTPPDQDESVNEAHANEEEKNDMEGGTELSLPAEESPSQDDSGEERTGESEETFFAQ